jgi:hypothetical protein
LESKGNGDHREGSKCEEIEVHDERAI